MTFVLMMMITTTTTTNNNNTADTAYFTSLKTKTNLKNLYDKNCTNYAI
jgi:hypothetical protein